MPLTKTFPRIHYQVHGDGGPPVLLVMGFGATGRVWRPTVEGLRDHYRVVTMDNRGIGLSEPGGLTFTMRDMAYDVLRVAAALEWTTFHLVGVSMGGMIAQEVAIMAPHRLRSLTLIATHAGGHVGRLPPAEGLRRFADVFRASDANRGQVLARLLHTPRFLAEVDPASLAQRMRDVMADEPSRRTLLGQISAVLRHDTRKRLSLIRARTLVVRAGQDLLAAPSGSDELHARIPESELLRFDESGHGVIFQEKDRLNRRLSDHFASADALNHPGLVQARA